MSDILDRARAALGPQVTAAPWVVNTEGWASISSGSDSVIHAYVDTTCVDCGEEICQSMDCHVAASIEDLEFIAAARTLVPELAAEVDRLRGQVEIRRNAQYLLAVQAGELRAEVERLRAENALNRRLSGQANYLLARIVAAANVSAIEGADGFIESYSLPVGPIHKAIPFLNEQGVAVTSDGQIKNGPDALIEGEAQP